MSKTTYKKRYWLRQGAMMPPELVPTTAKPFFVPWYSKNQKSIYSWYAQTAPNILPPYLGSTIQTRPSDQNKTMRVTGYPTGNQWRYKQAPIKNSPEGWRWHPSGTVPRPDRSHIRIWSTIDATGVWPPHIPKPPSRYLKFQFPSQIPTNRPFPTSRGRRDRIPYQTSRQDTPHGRWRKRYFDQRDYY